MGEEFKKYIERSEYMQKLLNSAEIEEAINKFGDIVISKNSNNNVEIMSIAEYKRICNKKNIIKKLQRSEQEIENGEGIEADMVFKELKQKYGY